MGLVKRQESGQGVPERERRRHGRAPEDLVRQLADPDPAVRRWAARDLAAHPGAADALADALEGERDPAVRQALLDALAAIGGEAVAERLIPLLRSEDAGLRNGVIEVLQGMPEAVAPRMARLLEDEDPDVRIFAVDICRSLPHPDTPRWLAGLLGRERHVNVVGTAIDVLAEIGGPEELPALRAVAERFADEPFVAFSAKVAIRRIEEGRA